MKADLFAIAPSRADIIGDSRSFFSAQERKHCRPSTKLMSDPKVAPTLKST